MQGDDFPAQSSRKNSPRYCERKNYRQRYKFKLMAKKSLLKFNQGSITTNDIRYRFVIGDPGENIAYEVSFYAYAKEKWSYAIRQLNTKQNTWFLKGIGKEGYPGLQVARGILLRHLNNNA